MTRVMVVWKRIVLGLICFGVLLHYDFAEAMQLDVGNDAGIDFDVTLTYGAAFRVSDKDEDLLKDINADDGNRNFDRWSMTTNKLTLLADINLHYKEIGAFVRPRAFYDYAYMSDNDNDSPSTNNALAGSSIRNNNEWADDVEDVHGTNMEILDLFAYGTFRITDRTLNLRVGRQTIQWGESLYIFGMVTSMTPIDVSASSSVGTETKEILLPEESVYAQLEVADNLTLAGYYQWKWRPYRLNEGGSYYSTTDFLDKIEAPYLAEIPGFGVIPALQRGQDVDADDDGQFGISLMYTWDWLNATEFGLYYINYHDKVPTFNIDIVNRKYFLSYTEDIKLYGLSFSSQIGGANVSGEFAYRQDYGFSATEKGDWWQAQTSFLYSMPAGPVADKLSLNGEIAAAQEVKNEESDDLAWSFVLKPQLDWYTVIKDLDVGLNFTIGYNPDGTNVAFTEKDGAWSVGLDFLYRKIIEAELVYEDRFGDNNDNRDRDTISFTVSYSF